MAVLVLSGRRQRGRARGNRDRLRPRGRRGDLRGGHAADHAVRGGEVGRGAGGSSRPQGQGFPHPAADPDREHDPRPSGRVRDRRAGGARPARRRRAFTTSIACWKRPGRRPKRRCRRSTCWPTQLRGLRDRIAEIRGYPCIVGGDKGTELTSNAILRWQEERKVEWHYIAPGKPMQNGVRR